MSKIMNTQVKYRPINVSAPTKSGILKPDSEGYYTVVLGGLNTFNSANVWYTLDESAKLFVASSPFQRNVSEGTIYSENGHPVRPAGMPDKEWVARFLGLQENRFTNTIESVWLDAEYAKKFNDPRLSKNTVMILGRIKPAGELKSILTDIITNPNQNLCYSIRCITDTFKKGGQDVKVIRGVITFDLVYSGGLIFSKKTFHPSTENVVDFDRTEIESIISTMDESRIGHLTNESCNTESIIENIDKKIYLGNEEPVFTGL